MKNKDGYFLIELVLIIVLISICLLPISNAIGMSVREFSINEVKATAKNLAEGTMEQQLNRPFGSITNISQTAFPSPLNQYSYEVSFDYVDPSDLNTPAGTQTEHKRIQVNIYKGSTLFAHLVGLRSDFTNAE